VHHTWRHDPRTTSTGLRRSEPPTRRRRIDNWQLSWVELCRYKRGLWLRLSGTDRRKRTVDGVVAASVTESRWRPEDVTSCQWQISALAHLRSRTLKVPDWRSADAESFCADHVNATRGTDSNNLSLTGHVFSQVFIIGLLSVTDAANNSLKCSLVFWQCHSATSTSFVFLLLDPEGGSQKATLVMLFLLLLL